MKAKALIIGLSLSTALAACGERVTILPGAREDIRAVQMSGDPERAAPQVRLSTAQNVQNWPSRGVTQGNAIPHLALTADPSLVWQSKIGTKASRRQPIVSAPVAADGRIFARGAGAGISAVDARGTLLWQRDLTPLTEKANEAHGGGLGYHQGMLFVGTGFGQLHALDAATGQTLWVHRFDAVPLSPTFEGDTLYLVTRDNRAWALNTKTGRIIWELPGSSAQSVLAASPAPAIAGRLVVFTFGSGEVVGALKRSGIRLWGGAVAGGRTGAAYGTLTDLAAGPIAIGRRIYAATPAGRVIAMDNRTGERIWTASEGTQGGIVEVGGNLFFVSDRNELMRLDAASGKEIWRMPLPYYTQSRLARRQTVVAHFGPLLAGGQLWLASSDALLRRFDPTTGEEVGQITLPDPAAASPIVVDGTLYVITTAGELLAYR